MLECLRSQTLRQSNNQAFKQSNLRVMKIRITKPDTILYDGEAKLVQLPGSGGKFEILDNHAPIISSLGKGALRLVLADGSEQTFDIRGGVVKGQQNDLLILVQ